MSPSLPSDSSFPAGPADVAGIAGLGRFVLRGDGDAVVAPALGVTFYLADAFHWAESGIVQALELFFGGPWRSKLRVYTTSLLDHWRPLTPAAFADVLEALARDKRLVRGPRHHFTLTLADDPRVPETAFSYTEIDPRRAERPSVLELTLPLGDSPSALLELARRTAALGPFYCGVGGYVARFNPHWRRLAFTQFFLWARRHLGLDVQIGDEAAWYAASALPGSNWLTFLGGPFAGRREIELADWVSRTWSTPGVSCTPVKPGELRSGVLVRAGEQPTLGDRNQLLWPAAYAEVARALVPFFPEEDKLPRFWGPFHAGRLTAGWMRRFVMPKDWP